MKIKTLLETEIKDEFENLSKLSLGTDEYKATVDGLVKLVDRAIEIDKLEADVEDKEKNRAIETELKLEELASEKKDRIVKNCIAIAGIGIPSLITVWGTIKSIKFEETGTITTIMGRGFIQKLLPKK